ncbi:arsenite methyltransferase [Beggiatoa leptomitoformis]|uniref:Arsenite methyltransferase n=1 Tax=Beggiatoa leptomitoformis TaxID=288004 RepID=A0A2N9YEN2_9GAMM|nr:arsenite methyltransferase [Beggiatoa leptomitoformis]ALG68696.1 arsenite methyltransferase [Beggiatoa leptomitoformis]AUI68951.1 arsenite methyltransferase [Beggiatoa leptomitoformis]
MQEINIKEMVKERYGNIAKTQGSCCGGGKSATTVQLMSQAIGYTAVDLINLPDGANLGLGCGNPTALASLKVGEVVLDLGSGAGIDCFLAARAVGETGRVIGIDMTPEMLAKARHYAEQGGYHNVEFRQGDIEALPVENDSIDVIISNCVINLATDKAQVFKEALRVLKIGGRLLVSDLVLLKPLSADLRKSASAYAGCIAGAMLKNEYLQIMQQAGFNDVSIVEETAYPLELLSDESAYQGLVSEFTEFDPAIIAEAASAVVSVKVEAVKV